MAASGDRANADLAAVNDRQIQVPRYAKEHLVFDHLCELIAARL